MSAWPSRNRPATAFAAILALVYLAIRPRGRGAERRDGADMAESSIDPLEQRRGEWTSMIAHDLKQPISVIALRSSSLLRSSLSRDQRDNVEHIARSGRTLERMVSDLMDASLLDSDRLRVRLDRLDLNRLVRDVVTRTPCAAARTRVDTPLDLRLCVKGDALRLEQIIANLLSNAVKYSAPGTAIDVTLGVEAGQAHLRVANVGDSIPDDELPYIFNRFSRGRAASASRIKGLGLGLYIARALVTAHRGRIWADSNPDGRTTFHVSLPLDGPPQPVLPPFGDPTAASMEESL